MNAKEVFTVGADVDKHELEGIAGFDSGTVCAMGNFMTGLTISLSTEDNKFDALKFSWEHLSPTNQKDLLRVFSYEQLYIIAITLLGVIESAKDPGREFSIGMLKKLVEDSAKKGHVPDFVAKLAGKGRTRVTLMPKPGKVLKKLLGVGDDTMTSVVTEDVLKAAVEKLSNEELDELAKELSEVEPGMLDSGMGEALHDMLGALGGAKITGTVPKLPKKDKPKHPQKFDIDQFLKDIDGKG